MLTILQAILVEPQFVQGDTRCSNILPHPFMLCHCGSLPPNLQHQPRCLRESNTCLSACNRLSPSSTCFSSHSEGNKSNEKTDCAICSQGIFTCSGKAICFLDCITHHPLGSSRQAQQSDCLFHPIWDFPADVRTGDLHHFAYHDKEEPSRYIPSSRGGWRKGRKGVSELFLRLNLVENCCGWHNMTLSAVPVLILKEFPERDVEMPLTKRKDEQDVWRERTEGGHKEFVPPRGLAGKGIGKGRKKIIIKRLTWKEQLQAQWSPYEASMEQNLSELQVSPWNWAQWQLQFVFVWGTSCLGPKSSLTDITETWQLALWISRQHTRCSANLRYWDLGDSLMDPERDSGCWQWDPSHLPHQLTALTSPFSSRKWERSLFLPCSWRQQRSIGSI